MNLPFFIAKRYLFSKKKQHIINIISIISLIGIMLGTMAMVVVLSVFNGFTSLFDKMLSQFDPDLKITYSEGKMFDPAEFDFDKIKSIAGIKYYAETVEEQCMLKYGNQQINATVKGVPENFSLYTGIDTMMTDGRFILEADDIPYSVIGSGLYYNLGIGASTTTEPIHIFALRQSKLNSSNLMGYINTQTISLSGIFSNLDEIDSKYMLVPLKFARELFECKNLVSGIEIAVDEHYKVSTVQKNIQKLLGKSFLVKDRNQQHDLIYKTTKSEKWIAYMILVFIIIIASINLLGSISMLILDKQTDISSLKSIGAPNQTIRRVFLYEGWLISFLGAIVGIVLGLFLCWLQNEFGIIKFPGTAKSFIIQAYPVKVVFSDLFIIFSVVSIIGFLSPFYPVYYINRIYHKN